MKFSRTYAIVLRHFYLVSGSAARVLPLFAWVGIDMVLWGFITRYLNAVASPGFNFVPTLLGAALLWDFLTRVLHGVTTAFFEDVWSRNFLNIFATPLSIAEYVAGLVLSILYRSEWQLGAMTVGGVAFMLTWALDEKTMEIAAVFYTVMLVSFCGRWLFFRRRKMKQAEGSDIWS